MLWEFTMKFVQFGANCMELLTCLRTIIRTRQHTISMYYLWLNIRIVVSRIGFLHFCFLLRKRALLNWLILYKLLFWLCTNFWINVSFNWIHNFYYYMVFWVKMCRTTKAKFWLTQSFHKCITIPIPQGHDHCVFFKIKSEIMFQTRVCNNVGL